jgi:hypothetical protein
VIERKELERALEGLGRPRVLIVGDVMLDRFLYGEVERISPEGPIPVLRIEREAAMLGGAGNVFRNLAALGVEASLIAALGQDAAGQEIQAQVAALGAGASRLIPVPGRATTIKDRFLASGQQLLRVDRETAAALPPETAELRSEVRAFLTEEAARGTFDPHIGLRNPGYDRELSQRVGARGWIGMTWPKQYGGAGRSHLERYVVTEEFRAAAAPTWSHFVADRQSGPVILKYGSREMKADILPRITRGEVCFAIGMSEPNSGSDLFAASTRAEAEGDHYRVNGTKI